MEEFQDETNRAAKLSDLRIEAQCKGFSVIDMSLERGHSIEFFSS